MSNEFQWYAGIDWGNEKHRVCLMNSDGQVLKQCWIEYSGQGLAQLVAWLHEATGDQPQRLAVAIEIPRGAIVETLIEHRFAVFSINPKQLDRFRDRYSPSGAKDDKRDAMVLADAIRTDRHCFHAVQLDHPAILRLRELSRLEESLMREKQALSNQLWDQLQRYFPQLLKLCSGADEAWFWDLVEAAPLPAKAARLRAGKITQILGRHRIRRWNAAQIQEILSAAALPVAPGVAEAAAEHVVLLLPRLRLAHQQESDVGRRVQAQMEELASPAAEEETPEHRDAAILLSLPGVGRKVGATILSEAHQAIAERDYHALRSLMGAAPVTRQSGKTKVVLMRYACSGPLRNALYHWSQVSTIHDPRSKREYGERRARGQSHGRALRGIGDRLLDVLISMLHHGSLFDPQRRTA
jgi:transposase